MASDSLVVLRPMKRAVVRSSNLMADRMQDYLGLTLWSRRKPKPLAFDSASGNRRFAGLIFDVDKIELYGPNRPIV